MRRFERPVLIAAFVSLATLQLKGCVADGEIAIADEVALVASAYCLAPAKFRTYLREVIDANAAPNRVRVECATDAL